MNINDILGIPFFQCIKTGGHIQVGYDYAYGDLYRFGSGHIMKACKTLTRHLPKEETVHAKFEQYSVWWEDTTYDYILLEGMEWFEYNGRYV